MVEEIQIFIEFANFYWYFISQYSYIAASLKVLLCTKNQNIFELTDGAKNSFNDLSQKCIQALFFYHFLLILSVILKTDTSDFAVSVILLQNYNNYLNFMAF